MLLPSSFAGLRGSRGTRSARGVSLIVVLLLLVIVSIIGVASIQIATMGERGARNDRDMQLAWQGAEAALVDAEIDLQGPNTASTSRTATLQAAPVIPASGCTATGTWRGLCASTTDGQTKPTWLLVDFLSSNTPSVPLGTFTGRTFAAAGDPAGLGTQPALAPRYLVEDITALDSSNAGRMVGSTYGSAAAAGSQAGTGRLYRVTAMGFGPRSDIQAVLQTIYRN